MTKLKNESDILNLIEQRALGRSLPQAFYTDADLFQHDLEKLWYKEWVFVASAAEFTKTGSYVTVQLGRFTVVLVRGKDGVVRAFHNTCRHRGSRICSQAKGISSRLVCPYHQWTYELDGKLIWARDMGDDFKPSDHSLAPVFCETAGGMVFISLSDAAPDFSQVKAAADRYAAPHRMEELKVAHQSTIIEKGNWKLVMENNRECYHCAGQHPALCRTFNDNPDLVGSDDSAEAAEGQTHIERCELAGLPSRYVIAPDGQWRLVRIPLLEDAVSYTMDGKLASPMIPSMPFANAGTLLFFHYPNTWNHYLSDHVLNFRMLPISATETEVQTTWLVHRDAVEGKDYDLTRLTEVWEATNDEDRRVVEENQIGIFSPAYRPGPYSTKQESGVDQFINWYLEKMRQQSSPLSMTFVVE